MFKKDRLLSLIIIICTLLAACSTAHPPTAISLPQTQESQGTTILPTQTTIQSPVHTPESQGTDVLPTQTTIQRPLNELAVGLSGLDFDSFVEDSYRRLLIRDPEGMLELGLSQVFGTPTDQLTNISDEYIRQTQALEAEILYLLEQYDRSSLNSEQQLTYDIYDWYLTDRVEGHQFMYDDYPINPTVFSVHLNLLQFFTDLRPVTSLEEAQDYVTSLWQVDTKFEQLINGLQRRESHGVMLPRFLVNWIIQDLNSIASSPSQMTPYYTALETTVNALSNLSHGQKQDLLTEAETAISDSVIPAYQALVRYFEHLQSVTSNDAGVWKFPDGDAYYLYILKHYNSTDLTADEIYELGLQALERVHAEMRSIFDQLGYPQGESLSQLFNRVANDGGSYTGEDIVKGYEDIITTADQNLGTAFDMRPSIGVIVVGAPIGGYYTPPAVDGSRPGLFYAQDTGIQPKFSMPTLAYHEAIPGHHFQIAIAQQLDLPSIRRGADFSAFIEGWALYAERLAAELGFYDNDVYGDLGRLQAEAFRAARLVVDTGIHARQWDFNQAVNFMVENTGMPVSMMQNEVSRYICLPGQATAYYIGYTRIMASRQRAMDQLGDQFDLKEFHNLLLENGAMPLDVLDQVVDQYIQSKLSGG